MYRSYETIEGGYPEEALEDFSGGIAEMVLLQEVPANFRETLLKAYAKKSFIGISSVNEPDVSRKSSPCVHASSNFIIMRRIVYFAI
jgi:hypothetical protein